LAASSPPLACIYVGDGLIEPVSDLIKIVRE
jgi:hypothetical protein